MCGASKLGYVWLDSIVYAVGAATLAPLHSRAAAAAAVKVLIIEKLLSVWCEIAASQRASGS